MLCCKESRSLSQSSFYFTCKYAASWHCPLCSVSLVSLSLLHISLCSQSWWPQMPPYLHSSLNVDIHVEGNCKGEDAPHPSPPPGPWCLRHQLPEITGCPENRSTEKMYKYRPYSSWEPDVWKAPLSKKKKKSLPQIIHSFTTQEICSFHWKVMTLNWTSYRCCSELFCACSTWRVLERKQIK